MTRPERTRPGPTRGFGPDDPSNEEAEIRRRDPISSRIAALFVAATVVAACGGEIDRDFEAAVPTS